MAKYPILGIVSILTACSGTTGAKTLSQDSFAVRLALPDDLLRGDTLFVSFGCSLNNGAIVNLQFTKEELAQGIKEKSLVTNGQKINSCESSVLIDVHAVPRSASDKPLWAPVDDFNGKIEAKYTEPGETFEIGLGDWKISTLSVTVSREAFDKRKASEVLLDIASDGYNFQWGYNLPTLNKDTTPFNFSGRIMYRNQPSFKVSTTWLSDEFVQEEFVTQNFDVRVEWRVFRFAG